MTEEDGSSSVTARRLRTLFKPSLVFFKQLGGEVGHFPANGLGLVLGQGMFADKRAHYALNDGLHR